MVTEPATTPWPPVLGTPVTASLAVAFAGFGGAAARLAEVIDAAGENPGAEDVVKVNVELSALPWFARTAVDRVRKREGWPGGADAFDDDQDAVGHGDLLNGFRWARNHAGHALARTAQHREAGRKYPRTYSWTYPPARWVWTRRSELPMGKRDPEGEDAYDDTMAGRDLVPSVQVMADWLTATDAAIS